MKKILVFMIVGLIIFTTIYTTVVFNSDFGIPDTIDYSYNYPCDVGYNKYEGGFVFRNCYVLELDWWDNN